MNDRHQDWCDPGPRGITPIVNPKYPSSGTCPKCGYVGPLRERSGALYPHKRFDRYAPEPTGEDYFESSRFGHCARCANPIIPGDFVTYDDAGVEIHDECPDCGASR